MAWFVYIIKNRYGTLYTGISTDPVRRLREHNESPRGAKCTKAGRPWALEYYENALSQSHALRRESFLKKLGHKAKTELIDKKTNRNLFKTLYRKALE